MSSMRDPDFAVKAYLDEGPDELPERSYDAVRAAIDQTRQWAVIGPWKEPQIMTATRFALIAAAIAVVAVVAIRFLPSTNIGPGPTSAPVVTPGATATPTPVPTILALPSGGPLQAGAYRLTDLSAVPITITVPTGWHTTESMVAKGGPGLLSANVVFGAWFVTHVYADACHWSGSMKAAPTEQLLVDALANQKSRVVTAPTQVTLNGTPATLIEMSVPAEYDLSGCDNRFLRSWPDAGGDESGGWPTYPGETQKVYVVNSGYGPLVVVTTARQGASAAELSELDGIVASMHIAR